MSSEFRQDINRLSPFRSSRVAVSRPYLSLVGIHPLQGPAKPECVHTNLSKAYCTCSTGWCGRVSRMTCFARWSSCSAETIIAFCTTFSVVGERKAPVAQNIGKPSFLPCNMTAINRLLTPGIVLPPHRGHGRAEELWRVGTRAHATKYAPEPPSYFRN